MAHDLSPFEQAFAKARKQHGSEGLFEFQNKKGEIGVFSTRVKEEGLPSASEVSGMRKAGKLSKLATNGATAQSTADNAKEKKIPKITILSPGFPPPTTGAPEAKTASSSVIRSGSSSFATPDTSTSEVRSRSGVGGFVSGALLGIAGGAVLSRVGKLRGLIKKGQAKLSGSAVSKAVKPDQLDLPFGPGKAGPNPPALPSSPVNKPVAPSAVSKQLDDIANKAAAPAAAPVKRGRGRPPGAKNKAKKDTVAATPTAAPAATPLTASAIASRKVPPGIPVVQEGVKGKVVFEKEIDAALEAAKNTSGAAPTPAPRRASRAKKAPADTGVQAAISAAAEAPAAPKALSGRALAKKYREAAAAFGANVDKVKLVIKEQQEKNPKLTEANVLEMLLSPEN